MQFLGPPDVTVTLSERSDSVVLEAITPGNGWDYFDVEAVPSLARSYINQTNWTLPLEITDLTRGTQYSFTVAVYFRSSCGPQQQSSVTETICAGDQLSVSILTFRRMEQNLKAVGSIQFKTLKSEYFMDQMSEGNIFKLTPDASQNQYKKMGIQNFLPKLESTCKCDKNLGKDLSHLQPCLQTYTVLSCANIDSRVEAEWLSWKNLQVSGRNLQGDASPCKFFFQKLPSSYKLTIRLTSYLQVNHQHTHTAHTPRTHTPACTHTHTYTHTYTRHTHTYTHTYTHTHTHTHKTINKTQQDMNVNGCLEKIESGEV